jgi:hypothetical protein
MTAIMLANALKPSSKTICILTMAFTFMTCTFSLGQDLKSEKPLLKERLIFGGSFSLQIGTITNIEVSPIVGIWLLPRIAIAAGPSYRFYKDPFNKTSIYGARTYLQYVVIQDVNNLIPIGVNTAVFFHGEYEGLSLEQSFWTGTNVSSGRFIIHTLLVGVGINLLTLWYYGH